MLDPSASDRDAARAALLPLDCSRKQLDLLLTSWNESETDLGDRFEQYGVKALKGTGGPDEQPVVNSVTEIAIFAALLAARIEFADPLPGTRYYNEAPMHSAERRMMERPLCKHPGLSRYLRDARNEYIYNVLYAFQFFLDERFQSEVVAALCAPDPEYEVSTPSSPAGAYHSTTDSSQSLHTEYASRITHVGDEFRISFSDFTPRCLIEPVNDQMYLPSLDTGEIPDLKTRHNGLGIPKEVVLVKLANYAWHGWYRLVHLIYQGLSSTNLQPLVDATPKIDREIKDHLKFRKPWRSFVPYYGAETKNPLMGPDTRDPISRPDKRLVTVVDTIRASPNLAFGEPIQITNLFDEICRCYPSPDRPGNDVSDIETLENALAGAIDSRISSPDNRAAYEVPAPVSTPFFPIADVGLWKQYRHELAKQTGTSYKLPDTRTISPFLPDRWRLNNSPEYTGVLQDGQRAAVVELKHDAHQVETVDPLVNPAELEGLSADEVVFLTRVGLAMERRIQSYSLVESMAAFDKGRGDCEVDVDVERLDKQGYLEQVPGRRTYYSVPGSMRRRLHIPNVSHDGWGERAPSEMTLHRVGVDLLAFLIASNSKVDRVARYCDAWRLQRTDCWDSIKHLEDKRLDVVGFSRGEPVAVCEVETRSGGAAGARDAVKKLQTFPDDVSRCFVTPNGKHLKDLMSRLEESHFDVDFGAPKDGGYRPADVRDTLDNHGALGTTIDNILTYANVRTELPDPGRRQELSDIIVGSI